LPFGVWALEKGVPAPRNGCAAKNDMHNVLLLPACCWGMKSTGAVLVAACLGLELVVPAYAFVFAPTSVNAPSGWSSPLDLDVRRRLGSPPHSSPVVSCGRSFRRRERYVRAGRAGRGDVNTRCWRRGIAGMLGLTHGAYSRTQPWWLPQATAFTLHVHTSVVPSLRRFLAFLCMAAALVFVRGTARVSPGGWYRLDAVVTNEKRRSLLCRYGMTL